MEILSLRMEGSYAKVIYGLSQRHRIRPTKHDKAAQLGALARLYWTDLLLIGFEPGVGLDLIDECFYDPLLRVMPVAVAFTLRDEGAFDAVLRERKGQCGRLLPIAEPDFRSTWLESMIEWHVARFADAVAKARHLELPEEPDEVPLPWEDPDGLVLDG